MIAGVVIVGAREAQPETVGAHGSLAIATDLPGSTSSACRGGLLGLAVGRGVAGLVVGHAGVEDGAIAVGDGGGRCGCREARHGRGGQVHGSSRIGHES